MANLLEGDYPFYRITHVDNVANILSNGLWAMSEGRDTAGYVFIGDNSLTNRRAQQEVPVAPGGTLADYIPFYFGPRSPMLYRIQHARRSDTIIKRPAEEIAYLCFRARVLSQFGLQFCFTDGHATMATTEFFPSDRVVKQQVDDGAIHASNWGLAAVRERDSDLIRRKQAELLILRHVPAAAILHIFVSSERKATDLQQVASRVGSPIKVSVPSNPDDFYY